MGIGTGAAAGARTYSHATQPPERTARLHCYYRRDHPFLILAPIKIERIYDDPPVLLLRQVLHDSEIERLKQLAQPNVRACASVCAHTSISSTLQLARALVVSKDPKPGEPELVPAEFRIAQKYVCLRLPGHTSIVQYVVARQRRPND